MVLSRLRVSGLWTVRLYDGEDGRLLSARRYRNTACQNGQGQVAAWLNGEVPALTPAVIYGAVGTGTGTLSAVNTQLFSELARVSLANSSRNVTTTTFNFYFNTSQAVGTWTEAGLFLQATATANSGDLLSHVTVSEDKTSSIAAVLACTITIGP